jgi:hypothetical protein
LKLVQKRAGNTLKVIGIGKDFLSSTQVAQQLTEMMDKLDYRKLKIFCTIKSNGLCIEEATTEREKIFASYTSDKEVITRIYRELKKLNSPNISDPVKKWAIELSRTSLKEEIQMANKHMKKCSPSLAIKKMQIKTILRFHLTPVRITIIKNTTNSNC